MVPGGNQKLREVEDDRGRVGRRACFGEMACPLELVLQNVEVAEHRAAVVC
jgi:hypothetical protein